MDFFIAVDAIDPSKRHKGLGDSVGNDVSQRTDIGRRFLNHRAPLPGLQIAFSDDDLRRSGDAL